MVVSQVQRSCEELQHQTRDVRPELLLDQSWKLVLARSSALLRPSYHFLDLCCCDGLLLDLRLRDDDFQCQTLDS